MENTEYKKYLSLGIIVKGEASELRKVQQEILNTEARIVYCTTSPKRLRIVVVDNDGADNTFSRER
jgi:hypothetical protein